MQSCQSCTVWYRMVVHSILLVGSLAFKRVSINDQSCCVHSLTGYLGLLLLLDLVHHEWDVFSLLKPTMASGHCDVSFLLGAVLSDDSASRVHSEGRRRHNHRAEK